jgi:hypothetical protein
VKHAAIRSRLLTDDEVIELGMVDRHRIRMREPPGPAGPFRSDRQKWWKRDKSVALTPILAIIG